MQFQKINHCLITINPPETANANQHLFIKKIKLIIGISEYVLIDIKIMYQLKANFEL